MYSECCRRSTGREKGQSDPSPPPSPYFFHFRVVRFACLHFHEEMLELPPETKSMFSWWMQWKLVECKFSFVLYILLNYTEPRFCHYKFIVYGPVQLVLLCISKTFVSTQTDNSI